MKPFTTPRPTTSRRSRDRGAATVELALGSLLFVTILMMGIHFGEVQYLSLKLHEAQDFAIWESTGRQAEQFRLRDVQGAGNQIYAPQQSIRATAANRAQQRYQDLDGRTRISGGTTLTQSLTQASGVTVTCGADANVKFEIPVNGAIREPRLRGDMNAQEAELARLYRSPPAMQCRATASLEAIRIPQKFEEDSGDGFFRAQNLERTAIPVCGTGVRQGGRCKGEAEVLLGDWSLDGPIGSEQNADVPLSGYIGNRWRVMRTENGTPGGTMNRPYREMVRKMWDAGGGSHGDAASEFARIAASQASPHDETVLYMSYRGAPRYKDGQLRSQQWNTSGMHFEDELRPATRREKCFLGLPGCGR